MTLRPTALATLLLSSLVLMAGCSNSLRGIAYDRGTVPGEFRYPHVQYGYVKTIKLLDAQGQEISVVTPLADPKSGSTSSGSTSASETFDTRMASSQLTPDGVTITASTEAASNAASTKSALPPALAEKAASSTSAVSARAAANPVEVTKKIRELGLYDFTCTESSGGTECTPVANSSTSSAEAAASSPAATSATRARIMVRLDSGKDYWFDQPVSKNWIPQLSDRVKVSFSAEPLADTSRVVRIEYRATPPAETLSAPAASVPAVKE